MSDTATISKLNLIEKDRLIAPNHLLSEQKTALEDLMQTGYFKPLNDNKGPYEVTISIQNNRLIFDIMNSDDEPLSTLVLSLRPYKRIIQDYFMMIRSYEKAKATGSKEKLEAIDMGRRGVHNEGAELLQSRLASKIELDFETARRLFTLICVLHTDELRLA